MPKKPLILFVDDEPQALKYFTKTVEDSYDVVTALNASDARNLMNEHYEDITVLISDQRMPTETGVQLLEYTRVTYPRIVRLLTTAYSDLSSAIDAVNTGGIYWYVSKPWNAQELKSILKRSTEYYYLQRDREQLMKSKANIFQQILLSDRAKSLILIANQLGAKGWRRTNEGLEEYLSQAHNAAKLAWSLNDTVALELRDVAECECRFLMSLNDIVSRLPASNSSKTHQLDLSKVISSVVDDVSKSGDFEDVHFQYNPGQNLEISSEETLLRLLIHNVILRIINMDGNKLELSVDVTASPNGNHYQVSFSPRDRVWSSSQYAALFSAGVPSLGGLMGLDMDLLASYFVVAHLGGRLDVNAFDQKNSSITVTLPATLNATTENLPSESLVTNVYDRLEQWIEHVSVEIEG